MATTSARQPRPGRPCIAPLPPIHAGWQGEVAALESVGGALALVLWRALRTTRLWSETPQERRDALFSPVTPGVRERIWQARDQAPELKDALETFALLLQAPERADRRRLATACLRVREWAEGRAWPRVAVHFAEAAAGVEPQSPARANVAGVACRRAELTERCAQWHQRAFVLAVRAKDREEAVRALLGQGMLLWALGRTEEARRFFERAARRAMRAGRRRLAAEAYYELMLLCTETGALEEAMRHARLAGRMHPRRHPRLPALARDVARLLVKLRHYTPAAALLERAAPLLPPGAEQAAAWCLTARAAAAAGYRELCGRAAGHALEGPAVPKELSAGALLELAEGFRSLEEWDRAEGVAALAVERARGLGDAEAERAGLALLDRVSTRQRGDTEVEAGEEVAALVDRMRRRLEKRVRVRTPARTE